jgi:hypothetical protein
MRLPSPPLMLLCTQTRLSFYDTTDTSPFHIVQRSASLPNPQSLEDVAAETLR